MLHTFRDRQRRTPLIPEDVKTDGSIRIDVGVVDLRGEADLRWLEGVVCRKRDREEEHATGIW